MMTSRVAAIYLTQPEYAAYRKDNDKNKEGREY
jgi:hypothetical protein